MPKARRLGGLPRRRPEREGPQEARPGEGAPTHLHSQSRARRARRAEATSRETKSATPRPRAHFRISARNSRTRSRSGSASASDSARDTEATQAAPGAHSPCFRRRTRASAPSRRRRRRDSSQAAAAAGTPRLSVQPVVGEPRPCPGRAYGAGNTLRSSSG